MDTLNKGLIHIAGKVEQDGSEGHTISTLLFISRIFHLMFSDHGWPWVTETAESKSEDQERDCYNHIEKCVFPNVYIKSAGGVENVY